LAHASTLWGCDPSMMEKFLTNRHIGTRSIILVAYNIHQAQDARDAMVKRVYAEMFQFLVDHINGQLSASGLQRHKFIGVLDIFGFESFEVNSFEQLCINFCNEKLQFHFNEHIFRMEQELYAAEGIKIPGTAFVDNQPTLDLLEAKMTGVFSMVDEEINVPRGSDEGLLQKILAKYADGKHPNLLRPKARDCKDFLKNFGVLHYAGPVFYNVTNFLEKNKDQLHSDIIGVLQASKSSLISKFFPEEGEPAALSHARPRGSVKPTSTGNANKKTLGFQFKTQLNDLIATLNSTFPHFVRCMKSNDLKAGNVFTSSRMQDQLRYAGLVEVCRIRKLGYPVRRPFLEFYKRYRCIELTAPDLDSLIAVLVKRKVLKNQEWAKGHTRVFMRAPQSQELELAREASLVNIAILFQKNARRMVAAKKYKYFKKIINDIHSAITKREENELKSVIDLSFELPWNGTHLKVVQKAKMLLIRIQEEKRVVQLLDHAISIRDINALKSALTVHSQMSPPFDTPLATEAKKLLVRLEEELILKTELIKAIAARERGKLVELLARAEKLQSDCNEVHQARALVARLDKEAELLVKLKDAMARESLDDLNALFSEFKSFGMESLYPKELAAAYEVKTVLIQREAAREEEKKRREAEEERQRKALEAIEAKRNAHIASSKAALQTAIAAKDVDKLNRALQDAIQSNVQVPEVEEARAVLTALKKLAEMRSQLQAALDVLRVKSETGLQELDLLPLQHAIDTSTQVRNSSSLSFRVNSACCFVFHC
jgi:myosin heavy subunit